jgi:hypothetical protein
MKIYQIYYKQEQLPYLDSAFVPYNNSKNPQPELNEWAVWNDFYDTADYKELNIWGMLSWKFKQKTNLTGQQFIDFINANPGYDVYFVNPAIINEAVFLNGWEQGDFYHPGLSEIADNFLTKIGYTDILVKELVLDRSTTMFASYFVATKDFWNQYMQFTRKIFSEADKDIEFNNQVFGAGLSNYNLNKNLPQFPFLNERLISTFIDLKGFNSLAYQYTADTIADKYQPYFGDISALSDLKVLINQYESDELYTIWNHYRHKFLAENPGILNLE